MCHQTRSLKIEHCFSFWKRFPWIQSSNFEQHPGVLDTANQRAFHFFHAWNVRIFQYADKRVGIPRVRHLFLKEHSSDDFSSSNLQICQQSTGEKEHEISSMRRKGGFPMYKVKPCLLSASGTSEMAATMRAILLVAAMAVVVLSPAGTRAQLSSCTSVILRLSPCLDYITGNVSTPSSQCCSQFASAVQSDPQCICALITSGISAAPSFGITVNQTQAFALPGVCSVQFPLSQCNCKIIKLLDLL